MIYLLNNLVQILLLAIFTLVLYLTYQISLRQKEKRNKGALRAEIEAEQRGYEIVSEATKKAEEMVTEAELDSIEMTARERLQSKELLKSYEHKLNQLLHELTENLSQKGAAAEKELALFREHMETLTENKVETTGDAVTEQLKGYLEQTQNIMQEFTQKLNEGTSKTLQTELTKVREEVDNYKATQLRALDERIIEIVNQVLSEVAGTSLSVDQHADLIRQALNKAKEDHAFTAQNGKPD